MTRFVILIHDHPFLHWDFLIEDGAACRTWRLLADPGEPTTEIQAEALPDHRLMYLDYEGPVSQERGSVSRWDHGTCEVHVNRPGECHLTLHGQRWQGEVWLRSSGTDTWTLTR